MTHNRHNRLIVRNGDRHWARWSVEPDDKIEKKIKKVEEKCLLVVLIDYLSNYSQLFQSSDPVSMEARRLRAIAYDV